MGGLLIGHGLIHLMGFVVPFRLATIEAMPFTTTAFFGKVDLGEGGARVIGMAWLLAAVLFVGAGIGLLGGQDWWARTALSTAGISAMLCVLGLPRAALGLAVDAVIAALIAFVPAVQDLGG
jgi:hypothetical protein